MDYHLSLNCPLGYLNMTSDGHFITSISFAETAVPKDNPCEILNTCKEQLLNYFGGKRCTFDLPLNPEGTDFQKKVWNELLKIPYGETITYMELAIRLGDPKAVRAVGTTNGRNPLAIVIPCHRVIGAGNKLTGYAGGIWRKKWLLELEHTHNPNKQTLF